jgi:hypothetical protein
VTRVLERGDLLLYSAFLPALLASIGLGLAAVGPLHGQRAWHFGPVTAIAVRADDYVQGLARLGIVQLPGYEVPPTKEMRQQ